MPIKQRTLKVFLCHAPGDEKAVRTLYSRLANDGMDVWLDSEKLLAGQDRELAIRKAVRESDAVVVCLSRRFSQAGIQHREIRLALDTAMEQPEGEIFIIPARLEGCEIPDSLKSYYPVDLFSERGYEILNRSLKADAEKKAAAIVETEKEPGDEGQAPFVSEYESEAEEKPTPRFALPARLERFRPWLDVKYFSVLIALLVLLFGNNIYSQLTGHSIFAGPPTSTPTPTVAATATITQTATDTPLPTDTSTPTVTLTPVPPTETLTFTPTVIPPVALGKDWLAGCISTLWQPYPSTVKATDRGDGCWKEPLHVFSAENGDLDFLAQQRNAPVEIYGLFVPLPERGTVTFKIRLRDLSKVDLWMGVFAEADVHAQGLLMIVPAGNVKNRVIVQKDPLNYETMASTSVLEQGSGYSVTFRFTENSAGGTVNPSVFTTNPVPVPSAQKWLFFGYKGLGGTYRLDGTFFSFELK